MRKFNVEHLVRFSDLYSRIMPYIIAGISLGLTIIAIVILSYLVLWVGLIGLGIFAAMYVKKRWFSYNGARQETMRTTSKKESEKGRIIDHDDQ